MDSMLMLDSPGDREVKSNRATAIRHRQLPDAIRWHQAIRFRRIGSTPTIDAIERAVAFPNFHMHLAAPWHDAVLHDARVEGGEVVAYAADGTFRLDFVIAGTGYFVDPGARPEIAGFADKILLWRDSYAPPADEQVPFLGNHPYLGEAHEYLEKVPGEAPYLRDIHVHNLAGFVSFGLPIGDVPSMRRDIPLVAARISRICSWPTSKAMNSGSPARLRRIFRTKSMRRRF